MDRDLSTTELFTTFVSKSRLLSTLLNTVKFNDKHQSEINSYPITTVAPGDIVYLNLREILPEKYESLPLPDLLSTDYMLRCSYGDFKSPNHKLILINYIGTNMRADTVNNWYVQFIGYQKALDAHGTLMTPALLRDCSLLASPKKRVV